MPGLGCEAALSVVQTPGTRIWSGLELNNNEARVVVIVVSAGSDSWGGRTRSGYSTGVYGIGCVLQCSVQCAVCSG